MNKLTTEQFIVKAKEIHGIKYDYSLVDYINSKLKIKIRCNKHDCLFEQTPDNHLRGQGCPLCGGSKKSTTDEFILKAKKIHGNKYDYSLVKYVNDKNKIKIKCTIHNSVFYQTPSSHISGRGCQICANNINLTTDEFIFRAKKIHGDKYDYSLVDYKSSNKEVKIVCKNHNIVFKQKPKKHLMGEGCYICGGTKKLTKIDFISRAKEIHGDKYNYTLVNYKNCDSKVKIICTTHNEVFNQTPYVHLTNHGCPICKSSKGELEIKNILSRNNIIFEQQKKFNDCKNILKLSFDFYLPKFNMCIEYDGIQHTKPIKYWKGDLGLQKIISRDGIKNNYCEKNNIYLLRISYLENIEDKLNVELKKLKIIT